MPQTLSTDDDVPVEVPSNELRGRLRHSLAARISGLVVLVLFAAGVSALVMLGQLRAFQSSFDRLTGVYVVFNQRLAEAHVQEVRIYELVRTSALPRNDPSIDPPDPVVLNNLAKGIEERNALITQAREPIDGALRDPGRYGGQALLADLEGIVASLDELQRLATDDALVDDPMMLLSQGQRQAEIDRLFKSLATQSGEAVTLLGKEVSSAQVQTERLTLALTFGTTVLGVLATIGVFLTMRPLRRLISRVRLLGRGDWAQRVEIAGSRRGDEVSQLATEFNMMAEALEERERRLLKGERLAAAGQLAAQITHEIRNPLSSVALNVELLEDELDEARPEGRHLLAEITKEVDRLTAVTEDYLRFARRPKHEPAELNLTAELKSLLDFMRPQLEASGVRLTASFPEQPAMVEGDANQLRQTFMNLLRNAQEAALDEAVEDEGRLPHVALTVECKGDRVVIVVSDNGGGIPLPPEQMDRIFEAFYTRKARGTGLGLPTVQQIVADHQGGVRVASTGPQGTSFEVFIPACTRPAGSVTSQAATTLL